ncbi:hypothetical protein DFS34DRAFT_513334 [Phlyctochytrium arcticum]|nr:hypothetical protein DFS34DRAFT_513334 [Phlyctochytrium arcticum]
MTDIKASITGADIHFIKKELLARQLRKEVSGLLVHPLSVGALVGTSSEAAAPGKVLDASKPDDFPLLRPLFNRLLLTFPPLEASSSSPQETWLTMGRVLALFQKVDSGGTAAHMAKRDILANQVVDNVAALLGKAVRTNLEEEEKAAQDGHKHKTERDVTGSSRVADMSSPANNTFQIESIEILEARLRKKKGLIRSHESMEYVIKSTAHGRTVEAHRDFSAFKHLHKELIHRPNLSIPALPSISSVPKTADSISYAVSKLTIYLRTLSTQPTSTLRDFLNQSEPIPQQPLTFTERASTDPQPESAADAERRADELLHALEQFRDDSLAPGGMARIFSIVGAAGEIAELPPHYQLAIEWWKICAAASMYRTFVAHDRAPEHLRRLAQFHSQAPYRSWAALLRGTNAVMVVKALGNLLLARPFGSYCLLQNMLFSVIDDEMAATMKEVAYVESHFTQPECINRAKTLVREAPLGGYSTDEVKTLPERILGFAPASGTLELDVTEKLLDLYWRLRRMRQLRELVGEDVVVHAAKDLLAIAYKPLSEAYKAADPGSFVRDGAKLVEDLLRVSEQEQKRYRQNPQAGTTPLQPFMTLLARHEHRIFTHVRASFTNRPGRTQNLSDIAGWIDDISQFFKGCGPILDASEFLFAQERTGTIDAVVLQDDLNRLRERKAGRTRRVRVKMLDRVQGIVTGEAPLDEEVDFELNGEGGQVEPTGDLPRAPTVVSPSNQKAFGMQGLWDDVELPQRENTPFGAPNDNNLPERDHLAPEPQPFGSSHLDVPPLPVNMTRTRSIQSFSSLLASSDEDVSNPEASLPDGSSTSQAGGGSTYSMGPSLFVSSENDGDGDTAEIEEQLRALLLNNNASDYVDDPQTVSATLLDIRNRSPTIVRSYTALPADNTILEPATPDLTTSLHLSGIVPSTDQNTSPPATPTELTGSRKPAGERWVPEWRDPVALKAVPGLLGGWMELMRPWLRSVDAGKR